MTQCHFEKVIRTHAHAGPFERCAACGKTICAECVGRHLSSGAVWCVRCAAVSISDDRLVDFTYRPPSEAKSKRPPRTDFRPVPYTIIGALGGLGRLGRGLLRGLAAPFRRADRQPADLNNLGLNLTLTTLEDKVLFGASLGLVIAAVVVGGLVYANLNEIPYRRVILVIALTCASWAIVSVYLRFLFDNPLGRTASQIVSYIIASFVAFLIGSWLINWSWLNPLFGGR